jgi:NitT/TauT family transport system substrate-binding protein
VSETIMLRRQVCQVLAAAALAVGSRPFHAWAQGSGETVDYGLAGVDALQAAAYAASIHKDFNKHGLTVNELNSQSGPRSKQMLAAGQIMAATSGCNDSLALNLAGKKSVLVYGFDRRIAFANMLVSKVDYDSGKYRTVADLAGGSIAVTQPQSATWLMAIFLADKAGIKDKVTVRGLGDFTTMLGALKSRQVAATIATIGMVDAATAEGWATPIFQSTSDAEWLASFGGDVPGVGVYVLADTIAKRRGDVQALVSGLVAGQDFLNQSTPEEITTLIRPDFLSSYAEDAVLKSVRTYKAAIWSKDNLITAESYQRLLGIMDTRQITAQEAAQLPYAEMVDMSFVKTARGLS